MSPNFLRWDVEDLDWKTDSGVEGWSGSVDGDDVQKDQQQWLLRPQHVFIMFFYRALEKRYPC